MFESGVQSIRPSFDLDFGLFPSARLRADGGMDDQASRSISTGQLNTLPCLHLRPINLVVFKGASGALRPGSRSLEVSFPLRCFQRLSRPYMATQLRHWRDDWNTRGTFNPVLSY